MSNLSQFTNNQNLRLLWDVLLDELHINRTNSKLIGNIRTVFESNVKPFTARVNPTTNIMDLNKQFLSQVVLAVNRLFPQDPQIKRIIISDEEIVDSYNLDSYNLDSYNLEPYKIEDIQASRQSEFEKEVDRKRMELETYMSPQKPKDLDFSDRNSDGKIKAMDSLVAEKMAQRNFEIETLQNSNYNTTSINPESWLKSKETSVKVEKNGSASKLTSPMQHKTENSKFKHISFDNNNNITLTITEPEQKTHNFVKKVTWNDLDKEEKQDEPVVSIFNKLKKQSILESMEHNKDTQYLEQKSMPLPQIKPEEIIGNQPTVTTQRNDPVIPKTEIIKQLNEMNNKIDTLYEMVFKLTNSMQELLLHNTNHTSCNITNIDDI
jgi:hypothetical protein